MSASFILLLRRARELVEHALGRVSIDEGSEKADHCVTIFSAHGCGRGEPSGVLAADGFVRGESCVRGDFDTGRSAVARMRHTNDVSTGKEAVDQLRRGCTGDPDPAGDVFRRHDLLLLLGAYEHADSTHIAFVELHIALGCFGEFSRCLVPFPQRFHHANALVYVLIGQFSAIDEVGIIREIAHARSRRGSSFWFGHDYSILFLMLGLTLAKLTK